jgi:hypothetical protein
MKFHQWDCVEGGIFHAERLLWMVPAEMACHHMAIAAGVI